MKRLVLFLCTAVLFISCSKNYTANPKNRRALEYEVTDFFDFQILCEDVIGRSIFRDPKTDVLYFRAGYREGITPIMKPDGTCLTLSEWEEENVR
jgi:hypothetical protein